MRMRTYLSAAFIFLLTFSTCLGQEKEKIALLLDRSPSPANAIGYVNVPALNRLMRDAGFSSQASESVNEVWLIADLDLGDFRPKWEAGYAVLNRPVDAEKLAASIGGYVDEVEHQKVVHSPQQTYFVPSVDHPERLGILRPTNRPLLASWLTPNINVQYAPFLSAQANQSESFLSFMLAVETKNVMSPVPLASRLEGLQSRKSNPAASVANILASMEGFSVIVGRQSLNQCIVRFYFSKSPASLKLVAADMLAEILDRNGLGAPEVKSWKATVEGNALALQGPITQSTLSGLLSVFSLQSQAESASGRQSLSTDDKEKQMAYESKHYFDQVNSIIDRTRDNRAQTTGQLASWNDRRARQIDEMGTLNVDPEMIQYGTDVAQLLRGNALTVRQTNIQAGKVKASQSLDRGYYNDGYGYFNVNRTSDYQRVTDAMARGNAYGNYKTMLSQIDKMTAAMRRTMTAKYQMQF